MSKLKSNSNEYFSQLNGIRFFAVLLVLVDHWFAEQLPFPLGHLGVVIFFVLSGFLITRILFQNADDCRKNKVSYLIKIKNFIIRRALRIFPIYYGICILGILMAIEPIRLNWLWMFGYASNWYIIIHKQWLGVWDHFWSLAVEEQYYLIFPYFILFLKPHKYLILLICMVIIGIGTRIGYYVNIPNDVIEKQWFVNYVNPFAAIDCFGLGGFLAYLFHYKGELLKRTKLAIFISFMASVGILLISQTETLKHGNPYFIILERTVFGLFAFFILAHCIQGKNDLIGKIFTNNWVNYLGKISYGIYLYHNFVYNVYHNNGNTLFGYFENNFSFTNNYLFQSHFFLFLFNFVLLIIISSISWLLIEQPFMTLKNKFE
ncbi:MAG: hypothetical protein RJA76_6 [Bacteroidota bacterium]|jgi:peptidoglycan/LPS O-acetylase OafA/YrhL